MERRLYRQLVEIPGSSKPRFSPNFNPNLQKYPYSNPNPKTNFNSKRPIKKLRTRERERERERGWGGGGGSWLRRLLYLNSKRQESVQWIPFLMFETLNSCRRKLVCAKIMPNVGKNLSWCALLPNFKKNKKRKLVSSQIRSVHFPHLRGQLWGVTTSQIHSFLSIFWHVALHRWGTIAYR